MAGLQEYHVTTEGHAVHCAKCETDDEPVTGCAAMISDELNFTGSSLTLPEEKSENEIFGEVKYLDLDFTFC
jgi:hypothetical protein